MSELVIVAAGGLAREAVAAVRRRGEDEVIGLVDDDPALWGVSVSGLPVVGGLDRLDDKPDAQVSLCAGRGQVRAALAGRIGARRSQWATVVDVSATVSASCRIGAGSIVLGGVVLTDSVILGQHVVVMPNVTLTHDVVIGDYATLCAGVSLGGGVSVGAGAYVGMNVSVREGVVIGEGATVGMGSVVLQDIAPGETWVGSPARHRPQPAVAVGLELPQPTRLHVVAGRDSSADEARETTRQGKFG